MGVKRATSDDGMSEATDLLQKDSVDYVLHDPLSSGFLSKYCDAHFCSENMRFIVDIDRYEDQFHRDKKSWPKKHWRELDIELNIANKTVEMKNADYNFDESFFFPLINGEYITTQDWPSTVITRDSIQEMVIQIWETYLAKDAKYWICISLNILLNTIQRIKYVHLYGKEVFEEALIDPVKTIHRDIYPRFVTAEEFRLMKQYIASTESLPNASKLKLAKPPSIIFTRYNPRDIERGEIRFTLQDLVEDHILYTEFLKYLEKIVSMENLLCLRAINIFKEAIVSKSREEKASALDHAWTIYKFFVAAGSSYEISISYALRKDLMRKLADPTVNMFEAMEQSAFSALRTHYQTYTTTKEYQELGKVCVAKRASVVASSTASSSTANAGGASSNKSSSVGCFGGGYKK